MPFRMPRRDAPDHPERTTLPPAPRLVSALLVLLVLAVAGVGALGLAGLTPVRPRPPSLPAAGLLAEEVAVGSAAALSLPPATRPPVPLAAALRHQPPLAPRETFGFLPYWTLPSLPTADLQGLTTVAYFSVGVDGAGQAVESGPGWTAYRSAALAQVVSEVHRAGGRVVLTLSCFSQTALDQLTTDPAAQATLAATAVHLVAAAGLDGVNLDLEGTGSADRAGLVQLVATVAAAVHHVDPAWQVTVDTYGSSAADPGGFFDVPALARVADALVVMAYDMQDPRYPGPTAPLAGPGETDQAVLAQYLAAIPASQVIVGLPLFAVAWPTTGPEAGAAASGPPTYLTDLAVPRQQVYWDPTTQTPWAVVGAGNAVDQVWFDDQASLAAKAHAALAAGVRGVALWALGMASPAAEQAAVTGQSTEPLPPPGPRLGTPEPPLVPIAPRAPGPPAAPPTPASPGPSSSTATAGSSASSSTGSSGGSSTGSSSAPPASSEPGRASTAGQSTGGPSGSSIPSVGSSGSGTSEGSSGGGPSSLSGGALVGSGAGLLSGGASP
jgi:hypothetical protein